jgi:5-carboxymethyl-2-hydroxymuconate isomerase
MPQLTLKISNNIDINQLDLRKLFAEIHTAMGTVPNLDIATCNSGVIKEDFSYIGFGDERYTKAYLEVYWLENASRTEIKKQLAQQLMQILENLLVPQIEKQNLICVPRVRIANLGELNQDYHIAKRS